MAEKEIHAIMIVEMLGKPPEYLVETLKKHVRQIGNMKGATYIGEKIPEPKPIPQNENVFSCFAEVEFKVEGLDEIMDIIFNFMPSSIEILDPANLRLDSQKATNFLNDLSGRLHKYDEIARAAQIRNKQIFDQMQVLQQKVVELQKKPEKKKVSKKKSTKKKKKK